MDVSKSAAAALLALCLLFQSCQSEERGVSGPGEDPGGGGTPDTDMIIDHACCDIRSIPRTAIEEAVGELHIAYGHTSHGSQIVTGMDGLPAFIGDDIFEYSSGGSGGTLDLRDRPFSGASDLGAPDGSAWEAATRTYLDLNPGINVIVWSWCGQVSYASVEYIENYLSLMNGLERDYPGVAFVYMTGHLDGTGTDGNLHLRNERIREFCRENGKILYDFADIESYDPDGEMYVHLDANDNCDYDSDGDNRFDSNWAIDWQESNPGDWYECTAAHTQPLNANLKAMAAWYLWARLAGWDGS